MESNKVPPFASKVSIKNQESPCDPISNILKYNREKYKTLRLYLLGDNLSMLLGHQQDQKYTCLDQ